MSAIEFLASPIDAGAALPSAERRRIFLYLGGLILLVTLNNPNGGLLDVPITFLLNRLHWNADNLAWFRLVAYVPLYLAFVFGLARDNLVAVGFGDRRLIGTFGLSASSSTRSSRSCPSRPRRCFRPSSFSQHPPCSSPRRRTGSPPRSAASTACRARSARFGVCSTPSPASLPRSRAAGSATSSTA